MLLKVTLTKKFMLLALVGVAQLVGYCLRYQGVASSIPCQGTCPGFGLNLW